MGPERSQEGGVQLRGLPEYPHPTLSQRERVIRTGGMVMSQTYDVIIIGGGILGLATAMELSARYPSQRVAVVEKEQGLAGHQTGHNSGGIHAGLYYRPGSQKAVLCGEGGK